MAERSVTQGHDVVGLETTVTLPLEAAFDLFTQAIAMWWPLENTFARIDGNVENLETIAIKLKTGSRWYEQYRDGTSHSWADVLAFMGRCPCLESTD